MPQVDVINQNGEKVGAIDLDDSIFATEIKDHLIHQVVVWQLAKRRQGSASTKTRGQVRGGGKKPWRQKGTGRARAGTNRSPIWTGGGTVFGPHPRSYETNLPKKVRRSALRSLLSAKLRDNRLVVVDKITLDEPKTKLFVQAAAGMGMADKKAVFITPEKDEILRRSTGNLHKVLVLPTEGMNVYDLLRFDTVVLLQDAVPKIHERLA